MLISSVCNLSSTGSDSDVDVAGTKAAGEMAYPDSVASSPFGHLVSNPASETVAS